MVENKPRGLKRGNFVFCLGNKWNVLLTNLKDLFLQRKQNGEKLNQVTSVIVKTLTAHKGNIYSYFISITQNNDENF